MPKPKDEHGVPLKAAHKRLDPVPYHEAALFAMDADTRSPALSMKRKLQIIDRAMDHVIDGAVAPAWIWKPNSDRMVDRFLPDMWRIAVNACDRVKKAKSHG